MGFRHPQHVCIDPSETPLCAMKLYVCAFKLFHDDCKCAKTHDGWVAKAALAAVAQDARRSRAVKKELLPANVLLSCITE